MNEGQQRLFIRSRASPRCCDPSPAPQPLPLGPRFPRLSATCHPMAMMAQVLHPTTYSSLNWPGRQEGGPPGPARDPGGKEQDVRPARAGPTGQPRVGLGSAPARWPGAGQSQGKGPRPLPFTHSLPQPPSASPAGSGGRAAQRHSTGGSTSRGDDEINKHLSQALPTLRPSPAFTPAFCPDRGREGSLTRKPRAQPCAARSNKAL